MARPCLKVSYIMKRDPDARAAYYAMRRRGGARADAETAIEYAATQCFLEKLIFDRDRRLEVWLSLQEGPPVECLFPDLPPRHRLS